VVDKVTARQPPQKLEVRAPANHALCVSWIQIQVMELTQSVQIVTELLGDVGVGRGEEVVEFLGLKADLIYTVD
jgi:hypothetical protein